MVPKLGPGVVTLGEIDAHERAVSGEDQLYRDSTDPENRALSASGAVILLSEYQKGRRAVSDLPDAPQDLLDEMNLCQMRDGTWMQIPF